MDPIRRHNDMDTQAPAPRHRSGNRSRNNEEREKQKRMDRALQEAWRKENNNHDARAREPKQDSSSRQVVRFQPREEAANGENERQALVQAVPREKKQVHWSNEPTIIPDDSSAITANTANTSNTVAMSDALVVNGPTNIESLHINNYNGGGNRRGATNDAPARLHPIRDLLTHPVFLWLVVVLVALGLLSWFCSAVRNIVFNAGVGVLSLGTVMMSYGGLLITRISTMAGLGEQGQVNTRASSGPRAAANIKPLVRGLPEIIAVVEWSSSAAHAVSDTAGYDISGMAEMDRLGTTAETLRERQRVTNEEWTEDNRKQKSVAQGLITQFQDLKTDAEAAVEMPRLSSVRCWVPYFRRLARCTVHERILTRIKQAVETVKTTSGLWRERIAEDDGGVLDQTNAEVRKVCHHSGGLKIAQSQMEQRLLEGKAKGEPEEQTRQLKRGLMLIEDQDQGLRMACHVAKGLAPETKAVRDRLKGDIDHMRVISNGLLITQQSIEEQDIDDPTGAGRVLEWLNQYAAILEGWEVDE